MELSGAKAVTQGKSSSKTYLQQLQTIEYIQHQHFAASQCGLRCQISRIFCAIESGEEEEEEEEESSEISTKPTVHLQLAADWEVEVSALTYPSMMSKHMATATDALTAHDASTAHVQLVSFQRAHPRTPTHSPCSVITSDVTTAEDLLSRERTETLKKRLQAT